MLLNGSDPALGKLIERRSFRRRHTPWMSLPTLGLLLLNHGCIKRMTLF